MNATEYMKVLEEEEEKKKKEQAGDVSVLNKRAVQAKQQQIVLDKIANPSGQKSKPRDGAFSRTYN